MKKKKKDETNWKLRRIGIKGEELGIQGVSEVRQARQRCALWPGGIFKKCMYMCIRLFIDPSY